jgi:hypothetical protein
MVLSDVDIKRYIAQGKIKVTSNLSGMPAALYARRTHPLASRSAGEFKG